MNILNKQMRTGTRLTIINWLISISIILFLNIVLPLLSLKFNNISSILEYLDISKTTLGLLGNGAIVTSVNEIRKAWENSAKEKFKK